MEQEALIFHNGSWSPSVHMAFGLLAPQFCAHNNVNILESHCKYDNIMALACNFIWCIRNAFGLHYYRLQ